MEDSLAKKTSAYFRVRIASLCIKLNFLRPGKGIKMKRALCKKATNKFNFWGDQVKESNNFCLFSSYRLKFNSQIQIARS